MKKIVASISVTLVVVTFVLSVFLNGILGLFGLAFTSVEALADLKKSSSVVKNLKERHKKKKVNISKRFVKRTGKKVASTAVAAATVGTAAVVVTVATLEAHEYCDDKRELLKDENLLYQNEKEFDYEYCLEEAKNDSQQIVMDIMEEAPKIVSAAWGKTKDLSDNAWVNTKDFSSNAWESTKSAGSSAWRSAAVSTSNLWDSLNSESEKESTIQKNN